MGSFLFAEVSSVIVNTHEWPALGGAGNVNNSYFILEVSVCLLFQGAFPSLALKCLVLFSGFSLCCYSEPLALADSPYLPEEWPQTQSWRMSTSSLGEQ